MTLGEQNHYGRCRAGGVRVTDAVVQARLAICRTRTARWTGRGPAPHDALGVVVADGEAEDRAGARRDPSSHQVGRGV